MNEIYIRKICNFEYNRWRHTMEMFIYPFRRWNCLTWLDRSQFYLTIELHDWMVYINVWLNNLTFQLTMILCDWIIEVYLKLKLIEVYLSLTWKVFSFSLILEFYDWKFLKFLNLKCCNYHTLTCMLKVLSKQDMWFNLKAFLTIWTADFYY